MKTLARFFAVGLMVFVMALFAENEHSEEYCPLPQHVSISPNASARLKAAAERFSQQLHGHHHLLIQEENPVCCVRIEIDRWTPTLRRPGYVVQVEDGGMVIKGTDDEQLEKGIAALIATSRSTKDGRTFPRGLLTNIPLIGKAQAPR